LKGLGEDLSQQAPTYDLGQELQGSDLNGAAGELDQLNDQLENLSPKTRQELADALEEAAGEGGSAGDSQLSEDMSGAAEALKGEDSGEAGSESNQSLDQLAQDLRDRADELNSAQANGSGAGSGSSGQTGSAEPAGRLQGEGDDFELPLEDSAQSGLLSPAPPQADGSGTASGSLDSPGKGENGVAGSPLVPNSFLWKWRDVVSSYFQR
jgi:ABC-type transporter Mla subunit MlaD